LLFATILYAIKLFSLFHYKKYFCFSLRLNFFKSGYIYMSTNYTQYLGARRCCDLKVQGPQGPQGAQLVLQDHKEQQGGDVEVLLEHKGIKVPLVKMGRQVVMVVCRYI
jgi:hypothetical protein